MIEEKLSNYLSVVEKVTREIYQINKPDDIPSYVSKQITKALGDEIQFAFIDLGTNKIYESAALDSTIQKVLPFFLQQRFVEEITKLDWSVVDQRGVRFLLDKIGGQKIDLEASFLIIPKKRKDSITHFSVLWADKVFGRIDKEEIDFISSVCGAVVLRMVYLLAFTDGKIVDRRELRRKAFELKELAGIGGDLTSLGKEDFFGSFLLNVMGRALSKAVVILLSSNENNTEYTIVASRGVKKKPN